MHRETNVRNAFRQITGVTRTVYESATLNNALHIIENQPIGVLVCGDLLHDADWRDVRRELEPRFGAPSFIVCAENPDVMLWADVLHRGGYAVLPLPLLRDEVLRTCWLAWMSRQSAIEAALRPTAIAARSARYADARAVMAAFAAA